MRFWNRKYNIDELKRFYRNETINTESLYLSDMWNMSDISKERMHDYIQWMLPTNQKSEFNRRAPVLTKNDIEIMKTDNMIMSNHRKSVSVFLEFLGLVLSDDDTVQFGPKFEYKSMNWLKRKNHNYKRITRLLTFLRLFGFDNIAASLMNMLTGLYRGYKDEIGENTYSYWQEAMQIIL